MLSCYGPDFTYDYEAWLKSPHGLGHLPPETHGTKVAIVGSGAAGIVAAYELMKLGLRPILYESGEFGGRLRSRAFHGAEGVIAELGGMRFPISSRGFYHYVDKLGLESCDFPNPLTPAAGSTVVDLLGETHYAETIDDLPQIYRDVAKAYDDALEEGANFTALKEAIRAKDNARIKEIWNPIVRDWDDRTFYDFVASSSAFKALSFQHREIFGQVGFGTGGWDSDFPNSMLEILRVNVTECDDHQRYIVGGVGQLPRRLWTHAPDKITHWSQGTTLAQLNGGSTRGGVRRIMRAGEKIEITDQYGRADQYQAVLLTCQSHLLSTVIETDESLFSHEMWMALDRTRYMQSAKTFVMVDRPFWKDKDPATGRNVMSMTLTDRQTRGTYLFDNGPDQPSVMCLSYSWMTDALKVLPLTVEERVDLALSALGKIYPGLDIRSHIIGDPITVSWEADRNFLGAFKGALPGHYRYNHRMYGHFDQRNLPPHQRGIFMAGDGISWTPAWAEGAVQTSLNAVSGIVHHLGGTSHKQNPAPLDVYADWGPVALCSAP